MGWKGTIRSINTANRRMERYSRQLEKEQRAMEALEAVQAYEAYLERIISVHKECSPLVDWSSIAQAKRPTSPVRDNSNETKANARLENYKPGFFAKFFGQVEKKLEQLRTDIEQGRQNDEILYQDALSKYEKKLEEWETNSGFAKRILEGDLQAYTDAWSNSDRLTGIAELGTSASIETLSATETKITLSVNTKEVIPEEQYKYLKSGKLSIKPMPKKAYYELYQDHVCSAVIRIAREAFNFLPLEFVIVTATGSLLNDSTGHFEELPILSVAFPRESFTNINFDRIDCSNCVENFAHRMDFKKTAGFKPIQPYDLEEFERNSDTRKAS